MVSELLFPPLSPPPCDGTLGLLTDSNVDSETHSKHPERAVNLHPIQGVLTILENKHFPKKKKKKQGGKVGRREIIFSRSVSTWEQLFYLELTNTE